MSTYPQDELATLKNKPTANPIAALQEALEGARFPTDSEPMLVHPYNTSVVKIRDTGAIDIFTSGHQGIRIDPHTATVNVSANTLKEHLGALRAWVTKDIKIECGTGLDLKCGATIKVHGKGRVTLSTDADLELKSGGGMRLICGGSYSLIAGGGITQKAGTPQAAELAMSGGDQYDDTVITLRAKEVNT